MTKGKQLSESDEKKIIKIIDGWDSEKLTWDLLCQKVERHLLRPISRQALDRHGDIKIAYECQKKALRLGPSKPVIGKTDAEQKLLEKIERLETNLASVTKINSELNIKFIRWSANAFQRGITEKMLELRPPIDREASKIPEKMIRIAA